MRSCAAASLGCGFLQPLPRLRQVLLYSSDNHSSDSFVEMHDSDRCSVEKHQQRRSQYILSLRSPRLCARPIPFGGFGRVSPGYQSEHCGKRIIPRSKSGNAGIWLDEETFGANFIITPVPEPSTVALIGLGAAALLACRRSNELA